MGFFLLPFFYFLFFIRYQSHHSSSHHNPSYASRQDFTPILPPYCSFTLEEKEFNKSITHSHYPILSSRYSKMTPNRSIVDPPHLRNETTDLLTIRKYFRYYQMLQLLQSPYGNYHDKIKWIQNEEKDMFPMNVTPPRIWNGLDW